MGIEPAWVIWPFVLNPWPPAVDPVLSCKSDERDLVRSWALGADAYLSKPTDPELIASKLREQLAAAAGDSGHAAT